MNNNKAEMIFITAKKKTPFFILCAVILISMLVWFWPASFEKQKLGGELHDLLKHNYTIFVNNENEQKAKFIELNGWLLLENVLRLKAGQDISKNMLELLQTFDDGKGNFGWWPVDEMLTGKKYFSNKPRVKLYYDIDVTTWGHRIFKRKLSDAVLRTYVSNTRLPGAFSRRCYEISCRSSYLLRVWQPVHWHDEMNIVVTANVLSALDLNSPYQRLLYYENKKFLNYIVEHYDYYDYFQDYDPKVTGDFLMLFYDKEFQPFLSQKAKRIVLNRFRKNFEKLFQEPLKARWNDGKDAFYGYKPVSINENVVELMTKYAQSTFITD